MYVSQVDSAVLEDERLLPFANVIFQVNGMFWPSVAHYIEANAATYLVPAPVKRIALNKFRVLSFSDIEAFSIARAFDFKSVRLPHCEQIWRIEATAAKLTWNASLALELAWTEVDLTELEEATPRLGYPGPFNPLLLEGLMECLQGSMPLEKLAMVKDSIPNSYLDLLEAFRLAISEMGVEYFLESSTKVIESSRAGQLMSGLATK